MESPSATMDFKSFLRESARSLVVDGLLMALKATQYPKDTASLCRINLLPFTEDHNVATEK
jgi:hypothetical protein